MFIMKGHGKCGSGVGKIQQLAPPLPHQRSNLKVLADFPGVNTPTMANFMVSFKTLM